MFGAFFIALAAATSNAASNVLQRGAHLDELGVSKSKGFSLAFLVRVIKRPRWLLGIITMIISFLLQVIGLGISSLSLIQPVLVLELPLTLVAAGLFLREELTSREWLGAVMMFCGVLIFVVMLDPEPGHAAGAIRTGGGALALVVTVLVMAALYLASFRTSDKLKTALIGLASGVSFGLTAVIVKDMTTRIGASGFLSIFSSWQVYGVMICGLLSVYFYQHALASGRLAYSQPGVTLADPFVATIWGIAVFNENVRSGLPLLLSLVGVALTFAGVAILIKSPLLKFLGD